MLFCLQVFVEIIFVYVQIHDRQNFVHKLLPQDYLNELLLTEWLDSLHGRLI